MCSRGNEWLPSQNVQLYIWLIKLFGSLSVASVARAGVTSEFWIPTATAIARE